MKKELQNKDNGLGFLRHWKVMTMTLLLLTFSIGQMWGAPTIPSTTLTLPATGLGSWTGVDYTNISYNDATNGYVIYTPYAIRMSKTTQTWYAVAGTTGSATGTWSATDIFKGNAYYSIYQAGETDASKYRMDVFKKNKKDLYHYYRVTNCTGVKLFYKSSASFSISLKVYEVTGEPGSLTATEVTAAANSASHTKAEAATLANNSSLSASKNYIIEVHGEEGNKANAPFYEIAFYYPLYTVTYDLNGGDGTTPTQASKTYGATFDLHDGITGITPPTGQAFLKWKDQDDDEYDGGDEYTMPAKNVTLTAQWGTPATTYDISFVSAHGTAPSATNASKVTLAELSASGWVHTGWVADQNVIVDEATVTAGTKIANGKTAHLSANTEFTAQWSQLYEIAKGTHTNGDITIDLAEAVAGATITLTATPDEDYVFSAWDVYKTGESSTKVSVTDNTFTMPAYAVTVNATFAVDERTKVLYVTANSADATKANDKLYAALKDTYNVKIVGPTSDEDQTGYDLIVLHESVGGGDYNKTAVATAKAGNKPVLNTKSYFYNSDRWGWGTPNAGQSVKGATLNSAYCNIASHPLFSGVTVTDGFFEITDDAAAKCMQPVGAFTSGKEGYTLATTPNSDSGNGTAIHELTPTQRGASAGKYLMISVSNGKLNALNANGQKLFQNAAAYLIGSTSWDPINAITSPEVTASPSAAYSAGDNIALTASATGAVATTTYTWYKGATWEAAEEAGAIKAAATAAAGGNTYGVTDCAAGDAGIYWCVISNGTGCDAKASLEVTVSTVSYNIAFASAHGTAPTATTGVAYTLPELTESGWAHQGWTASIDVTVDAATVDAGTLIANGKVASFADDVTFTAVWKQEFQVTFNLNGHGDPIAAQIVVDGELATDPGDPSEIGYDFGGWFTDAECTAGNEFDFATPITATTPLFAKWTAFAGCVLLVPATSGEALAVDDEISMQSGSKGGKMHVVGTPLLYNAYGLSFEGGASAKAKVTINNDIQEGTVISLTLVANGTSSPRGLHLYAADGSTKIESIGWTSAMTKYDEETFTYTVKSTDVALIGTNEFQLWRNNSVFLKQLAITNCGDPIIYHNLTSAITPDHDPAYATVTLGASSVREGRTTTATYSDIASGYEFDEWQISGTGASIADASANPAVITMGTADAVVTLKLKVATVKHTVTFNTHGGSAVAPVDVEDGQKLAAAPSDPTKEDYIFQGWAETADGAIVDVTSFTISADKEFHAVWVAETGVIKLLDGEGNVNTTNFTTGVTAGTVNFDDADHNCANFGSTGGSIVGLTGLNKVVAYNATTTQTKVKFVLYNTNNAEKEMYLQKVVEGATEAVTETIAVPSKERHETQYYTFNSSDLRSFYVTVNSTNIKILQVKVVDDGAALKRAGEAGYELNLNLGRVFGAQNVATNFEGLAFAPSSNAKVLNSTELPITTPLSFTIAAPLTLKVTTSAAKYYVSQNSAEDGTTATAMTETGEKEFNLTVTGTWYIVPSTSSAVKLTNLAFTAPKCAEPAFNSLANSDICSGDPYVALNGTATVADAGVPTYQWYREDNSAIDGETNATYTPSADGKYYVIAVNHLAGFSDNEKKSALVTVTTHAGTAITTGLAHVRKTAGEDATLTVEATGKNLHYAWKECETIDGSYTDVAGAADNKSLDVVVPDGVKYYKVIVSSDCGDDQESIAKVEKFVELPQLHITGSTTWDLTTCADAEIKLGDTTSPKKGEECLMANIEGVHLDANFNSQALVMSGEYIYRNVTGKPTCAEYMKFETSVAGLVRVHFAGNGSNRCLRITSSDNVQYSSVSAGTSDDITEEFEVAAGEIELMGMNSGHTSDKQYMRFFQIEFLALENRRTAGWIKPGELGTVCLENTSIVEGATIYELQGPDQYGKLVFDEVQSGVVVAGTPYLFEATATGQISFYKKVNAAHADEAGELNGMHGTFSGETFSPSAGNAANLYYFSGNAIWCVANRSTDANIPAHGCYLNMEEFRALPIPSPTPAPGRRRITLGVNGKNTPTAIDNAEAADAPRKVMINGNLYILRGEKMYDATGRLVK